MAKQLPTSMPSGGGGRTSGGITGSGGKNVTPIYKESIPPASVKVVKPAPADVNKTTNNIANRNAHDAKSGRGARTMAQGVNAKNAVTRDILGTQVVKIKSN